ncbi:RinA family phage transcriptional activator [Listeria monocytogenes]|uniref:RinA family phage transcriptional activator n=1 Tax=Listeria monocytogenes TaxID=1639 RepID=UPI002FDBA146
MSKRLRKAQYKLIEDELKFYHSTKKELMEKEVNVTLGAWHREYIDDNQGGGSAGNISNEVEDRVMLLQMDKEISRLKNIINAIESVLNRLNDEDKQLIQFRYWDRSKPTWVWIASKLNMDESTARRRNKTIILSIAERLGY